MKWKSLWEVLQIIKLSSGGYQKLWWQGLKCWVSFCTGGGQTLCSCWFMRIWLALEWGRCNSIFDQGMVAKPEFENNFLPANVAKWAGCALVDLNVTPFTFHRSSWSTLQKCGKGNSCRLHLNTQPLLLWSVSSKAWVSRYRTGQEGKKWVLEYICAALWKLLVFYAQFQDKAHFVTDLWSTVCWSIHSEWKSRCIRCRSGRDSPAVIDKKMQPKAFCRSSTFHHVLTYSLAFYDTYLRSC